MKKTNEIIKNIFLTCAILVLCFGLCLFIHYSYEANTLIPAIFVLGVFGKVMTYSSIIKAIWKEPTNDASIKKLQVNMANIRKKFGAKPGESSYIVNELGVGYRMDYDN